MKRAWKLLSVVTLAIALATPALAVDLIGYYEFEGNFADSAVTTGPASAVQNPGQVSFVGGFRGQAVDINDPDATGNGNNSGGTVDIPFNVSPPAGVSFGGWFNLDTTGGFRGIVANDNGGWDRGIQGQTNWGIASGGNLNNVAPFNPGNWEYVIGTFGNGTATLYVGGDNPLIQTTASGSRADSAANNGGLAFLEIGRYDNQEYDGQVDDFTLWDAALTADQANAVRNLRLNPSLDYSPADAELLFDLFDAGVGEVMIGDTTWSVGNVGPGSPGQLFDLGGGDFGLLLNSSQTAGNNGLVGAAAAVPEPSTIAIWTLFGVVGFGFGWRKMRRQS